MSDPSYMTPQMCAKIGSILVHVEESISDQGHPFDALALKTIIEDPEVQEWLEDLRRLALVPVKR